VSASSSAPAVPGSGPLPTAIALTALDATFRENPYPVLAELRRREPIHHDTVLKQWVFTRHDEVHAILRDLTLWSDPRKATPGTYTAEFLNRGGAGEEPSMLMMDDPGHRRLRGLVRKPFTPKAIGAWRPRVRSVAERIVGAIPGDTFDLAEALAAPLPTVVIAEMLGLDPACYADFKEWSELSVRVGFNPAPEADAVAEAAVAGRALESLFRSEIEKRRRQPGGEDLIGDMVRAEEEGETLNDLEIVSLCNLLLIAGNVTTSDLIGNGTKALIDFPEQARKLRERPELLPHAIEELLRYDSPVTDSGRIASRDVTFDGITIPEGETLSVSLAASNRDPAVYADPDVFDIEREDRHHIAFGGGRHFCLGSHLAQIEAQEAFRALLARFPRFELASGGYRYGATPGFRGFEELQVKAVAPA
jgi:cytochrome P450